jgi:hypothetical protein
MQKKIPIMRITPTITVAILVCALAAGTAQPQTTPPKMKMTTDIPPQITTPDKVETRLGTLHFFDGFPDDATVEKVYDNLDFERGVQVFLTAMPGASAYGLREGLRSEGANNQTVLIMEDLMDSKSLFLTPNTETVYNLMWLDLKDGPLNDVLKKIQSKILAKAATISERVIKEIRNEHARPLAKTCELLLRVASVRLSGIGWRPESYRSGR